MTEPANQYRLASLIEECRDKSEIDDQIALLFQINAHLPRSKKLSIPSLITRDYVSKALDMIQERINPANAASTT